MSQRQQLRLVFSNPTPTRGLCKMSLTSPPTRSSKRDSVFVEKVRTLERLSVDHAAIAEGLVDRFIAQILGAPLE